MTYSKLVRDNIPEIITENGESPVTHIATNDEYSVALHNKLKEEVEEFLEEPSIEELADILEVVDALIVAHAFSAEDVLEAKEDKFEKRGGFYKKIILDDVVS